MSFIWGESNTNALVLAGEWTPLFRYRLQKLKPQVLAFYQPAYLHTVVVNYNLMYGSSTKCTNQFVVKYWDRNGLVSLVLMHYFTSVLLLPGSGCLADNQLPLATPQSLLTVLLTVLLGGGGGYHCTEEPL